VRQHQKLKVEVKVGADQQKSIELEMAVVKMPASIPSIDFLGAKLANTTAELVNIYDTPASGGVLVLRVEPEGWASKAGFQDGDVIVSVARKSTRNLKQFLLATEREGDAESVQIASWRRRIDFVGTQGRHFELPLDSRERAKELAAAIESP
jgi:S1-C subfamily serine protease